MIQPSVESIHVLTPRVSPLIEKRGGYVGLEPESEPYTTADIHQVFHAANGLEKHDVLVTYGFDEITKNTTTTFESNVPYFVTRVNEDGSGIPVSGKLIEDDPQSWHCERLTTLWKAPAFREFVAEILEHDNLAKFLDTEAECLRRQAVLSRELGLFERS